MKPPSRRKVVHQARKMFSKSKSQSSSFFNASVTYKRQLGTLRVNNRELAQQLSSTQQKVKDLEGKNFMLQKTINLQIPKIVHGNLKKMVDHLKFYLAIVQQTMQFCQNPDMDIDVDTTILNPDIDLSMVTPLNVTRQSTADGGETTPSSVRQRSKPNAPTHICSMTPIVEQDTIYERGSLSADNPDRHSRKSSVLSDVNVTRRTKSKSRSSGHPESEKISPVASNNNESEKMSSAASNNNDDKDCSIIGENLVMDCSVTLDRLPTFIRPISTPRITLMEKKNGVPTIPKTYSPFTKPFKALHFDENHDEDENVTVKIPVDMDLTIMNSEDCASIVVSNEKQPAETNLANVKPGKKPDAKTTSLNSVEAPKGHRKSIIRVQDNIFSGNGHVLPTHEGKTRKSVSNYRKSISQVCARRNGSLLFAQNDIASPGLKRRVTFQMDEPPLSVVEKEIVENERTDANSSSDEDFVDKKENGNNKLNDALQKTRTSPRKQDPELNETLVQKTRTSPRKLDFNFPPQDPAVVVMDRENYTSKPSGDESSENDSTESEIITYEDIIESTRSLTTKASPRKLATSSLPSSDENTEGESSEDEEVTESNHNRYLTYRTSPRKLNTDSPQSDLNPLKREHLSRHKSAQSKILVESELILSLSSSSDDDSEPRSKAPPSRPATKHVDVTNRSTNSNQKINNTEMKKPHSSPVKIIPPSPSVPRSPISKTVSTSPKPSLDLSPSRSKITDDILSVASGSGVVSRKRIRRKYRRSSDSSSDTSTEDSSDSDYMEQKKKQSKIVNPTFLSSTRGQKTNEKNRYLIKKSKPGPKSSKKSCQDQDTLPKSPVAAPDTNVKESSFPSAETHSTTSKTVKEKPLKTFANLNNSSSEDSDDKTLVYEDKQMGKTATNLDNRPTVSTVSSSSSDAHDRPTAETDEFPSKSRNKLIGKFTLTKVNLEQLMNSISEDSETETGHVKPTVKTDKLPQKSGKKTIGKLAFSKKKRHPLDSSSNEESDDTTSTIPLVPKKELISPKPVRNAKPAVKTNKLNSTSSKKLTGRNYVSKKKANLNIGTEYSVIRDKVETTPNSVKTGKAPGKSNEKVVVKKSVATKRSRKEASNRNAHAKKNTQNAKNGKSSSEVDDDSATTTSKTKSATQKSTQKSADHITMRDAECVRNMAKTVAVVELPTLEAEQKRLSRVFKVEPVTPAQGSSSSASENEHNSRKSLAVRRKTSLLKVASVKKERLSKAGDDSGAEVLIRQAVGGRRAKAQVSYAEPSLMKKMRRPQ